MVRTPFTVAMGNHLYLLIYTRAGLKPGAD